MEPRAHPGAFLAQGAEGGGLFIVSGLLLLSNTTIASNHAAKASAISNPSNAYATYLLPAPSGTYLDHYFLCTKVECPNLQPGQKCGQVCDFSRYEHVSLELEHQGTRPTK